MANAPISYPLGAPTYSGTTITVDTLLNDPKRITRFLSDLTLRNYISGSIFSNDGGVSGGAVVYDQLTSNQLFPDRDVQHVEPGAEFPIITNSVLSPQVAQVEKFGGKFFITDEARDRNSLTTFRIAATQLSNAIVRKTDTRALAVLDTALTAASRTAVGVNWGTAVTTANGSVTAAISPAVDFGKVQLVADTDELGVQFNLWIVNPAQMNAFTTFYGAQNVSGVLAASGVRMIASNRVAAGTAYVLDEGAVGGISYEQGFNTETWREQATERTWVQSSVRPVFYVTNPYSALKITGLAG